MDRMKVALCTGYGAPELVKIVDRPIPVPKDDEILIRVRATTVSSLDCWFRGVNMTALWKPLLWFFWRFNKPGRTLGSELAGKIEAVGKKITAFKTGDSVFAWTGAKTGAHAEYIALPAGEKVVASRFARVVVVSKPDNISYEQAAALPYGGITALHFFRKANLQKGRKILIYGASGCVGTIAVQLAGRYFGAEVTGVCSGANKELVKSLGADHVIDYSVADFRTGSKKYDIIFDAVGKITKSSCRNALATGGRYITVNGSDGNASGRIEDMRLLAELAQNGTITPVIDRTYPLEQIVDAYTYVDTGRKKGNVVIKIAE